MHAVRILCSTMKNPDEVESTLPLHHGFEAGLRFGAWVVPNPVSGNREIQQTINPLRLFPQPHLPCPITHRYKTRGLPSSLCDTEQLLHSQSIEESPAHSLKPPATEPIATRACSTFLSAKALCNPCCNDSAGVTPSICVLNGYDRRFSFSLAIRRR